MSARILSIAVLAIAVFGAAGYIGFSRTDTSPRVPQATGKTVTHVPSIPERTTPPPITPSEGVEPDGTAPLSEPSTPAPKPVGYTMADVALHANAKSCWSAINGNVYDFTSYIPRHPGGERKILDICGKDGSSAFEGKHGEDTKPEKMLESLRIGLLL